MRVVEGPSLRMDWALGMNEINFVCYWVITL